MGTRFYALAVTGASRIGTQKTSPGPSMPNGLSNATFSTLRKVPNLSKEQKIRQKVLRHLRHHFHNHQECYHQQQQHHKGNIWRKPVAGLTVCRKLKQRQFLRPSLDTIRPHQTKASKNQKMITSAKVAKTLTTLKTVVTMMAASKLKCCARRTSAFAKRFLAASATPKKAISSFSLAVISSHARIVLTASRSVQCAERKSSIWSKSSNLKILSFSKYYMKLYDIAVVIGFFKFVICKENNRVQGANR